MSDTEARCPCKCHGGHFTVASKQSTGLTEVTWFDFGDCGALFHRPFIQEEKSDMHAAFRAGIVALSLSILSLSAEAGTLEGAGIGAGVGAVVLGPVGAVAGGVIGAKVGGPNIIARRHRCRHHCRRH
jgi:osmotically inducible lipoprotein OsmB